MDVKKVKIKYSAFKQRNDKKNNYVSEQDVGNLEVVANNR